MLIEVTPLIVCPFCRGTRRVFNDIHHKMMECGWCMGKGWCAPIACKGCGRPAGKFWPPNQMPIVRYCGDLRCLGLQVKIHGPSRASRRQAKLSQQPMLVQVVSAIDQANRRHGNQMEDIKQRIMRDMGEDEDRRPCM